jgi:hypothetical protein
VHTTHRTPPRQQAAGGGGGALWSPPASFHRREEIIAKFDSGLLGCTPCQMVDYWRLQGSQWFHLQVQSCQNLKSQIANLSWKCNNIMATSLWLPIVNERDLTAVMSNSNTYNHILHLLTVHHVMILGKWPTWRTVLYYVIIFIFNSLYVSSTSCSSSGETKCVNTTSGNCHSVSVAVSCAHDTTQSDSYQRLYWHTLSLLMMSTMCSKHIES